MLKNVTPTTAERLRTGIISNSSSTIPGNPSINIHQDIDTAITNLTEQIHASINQSSITKHIKHQTTFIPHSTRLKIREKNRLRQLWQFYRYPPLRAELNRLKRSIRRDLQATKEHAWDQILSEANSDPNTIHKITARNRKPAQIPPLLGHHELVYSIQDKANLFMETLEESFKENPTPYNDDHIDLVDRERIVRTISDVNSVAPPSPTLINSRSRRETMRHTIIDQAVLNDVALN
ncbi:putative RNA-directed DNA polymerase from transposon X-element [Trichonephila clavata]|uniref:Putative RNA-directed DNA polymerase from transposon X-element n=1 Tax=Trichonephila clavata TaxID=2740835 RepID=A0A8X6L699_TRICU|nr:putative RNA-directed DNA polymerase from transposon X-element [Trichonephila clavata]